MAEPMVNLGTNSGAAESGPMRPRYFLFKSFVDRPLAVVALLVLWPLMFVVAVAIRLDSRGPALFKQVRIGIGNTKFVVFKFRTMTIGTPDVAKSFIDKNDARITRIGGFLRRTSLDELPQLLNVVRGEMSIVGPRPALYNQYDLIKMRTDAGVHRVRPGITGLAQINGREAITLEHKVALDQRYVDHWSPWLDLAIVLGTPRALLSSRGTY